MIVFKVCDLKFLMQKGLFLFFLSTWTFFGQNDYLGEKAFDSITNLKYVELYQLFFKYQEQNKDKAKLYAMASIDKAKKEDKSSYVAHGFTLISKLYPDDEIILKYADSIIQWTENKISKEFPARGYLIKGDYFFRKQLFSKAFHNYSLANHFAMQKSNPKILYACNRSLGLIKSNLGLHEDALKIFQESYQYASKEEIKSELEDLYFLSYEFNKLRLSDSALYYNTMGIRNSLNTNNIELHNLFVLNSGITNYHKKVYQKTIDNISKAIPYLEEQNKTIALLMSYLYLGKAYSAVNLEKKSVYYFKKMDSIDVTFQKTNPEIIEGYRMLINYYKKNENSIKRVYYSKKLFRLDSVFQSRQYDSLKIILKDYKTPLIMAVTDSYNRVNDLRDNKFNYTIIIHALGVVFLIMISGLIFFYKDRNQYKKSFNAVVAYTEKLSEETEPKVKEEKDKKLNDLNISQETVDVILKGISKFEKNNRYLNKKYSLSILAKEINTNSTYLSKVINIYMEKSFSNYLHDLRIGYAVDRLREDRQFRLYSIKGISEEVGFKNSESFSKAFHKKTGIYPSAFIKKLQST